MPTSPLRPTELELSGTRITATYRVAGDEPRVRDVLEQLVVEQTIEFPRELVPDDDISRHLIGRVEATRPVGDALTDAQISFAVELAGGQLPQLINVLFGNISMVPGVRLVDIGLPPALLDSFCGPQLGLPGLRRLLESPTAPLLATALKPIGTPIDRLADMAYELAVNGVQLVKDDHSFATQPFASFRERVPMLAKAVKRAGEQRGAPSIYLPALNLPTQELAAGVEFALESGAGGLLALPGIHGHDTMRWLADSTPADIVIMAHPSLLGSHVVAPDHGIAPELVFGTFARLAGADVSIFPNHSGRFSFSEETCRDIARTCAAPLGSLAATVAAPAGGMNVPRIPEMLAFYGTDVCLLIGGDLYRGDIATQVQRTARAIRESI